MMVEHHADRDEDRALVHALQSAEDPEGPFQEIFRRYRRRVTGFFVRRGLDGATCDELSQETFLRVYRNRRGFRGEVPLASWIFQIAANLYRNELRRSGAGKRSGEETPLDDEGDGEVSAGPPDPAPSPLDQVLGREQLAALEQALAELPAQMRRAMQLRVHHDYSVAEIAAVLKITESTVKVHLHHARKQLHQALADRFGELPF